MKKYCLLMFSLLASAITFPTGLSAQNRFYFPFVANDSQTSTDLVFTNATGQAATVTLSAFQQNGTPATLTGNPLHIPANAQVVLGADTFASLRGWVLAESDIAGVTGNLRVGSPDHTSLDIAEPALPATDIILPFIAQGAGTSTEVSIVNPTQFNARTSVTLYGRDGSVQGSVAKTLPPYGMLFGSVASIFPSGTSFDNASHVVARATPSNIFSPTVNLIGFEVLRGFQSNSQNIFARTDLAALTGIPFSNTGQSLTFAHVPTGLNWFSLIGLVNLTSSPQTASLSYRGDSGNLIPTPKNPVKVSIPANGSVRLTSKELFGIPDDNLRSGSVQVSSNGNLAGFLGVGRIAGSSLATSPAQAQGQTTFLFSAVEEAGQSFTGIALLNSGGTNAGVDLFLISPEGATLGKGRLSLGARQRKVSRVKDLLLEGLNQSGGYILVRSSVPIFASGFLGIPDTTLSALSPQITLAAFIPPAQSLFAIRGKITFSTETSSAPVAGVTVSLSKGVNQLTTATTDAKGEFLFRNLISGEYTVTPSLSGKAFDPSSRTVRLDKASEGQANFGILDVQLPVVTSVTPTETFARYEVNSAGLTITVNGFGFKPGAQLLFDNQTGLNGIGFQTTYINSTQLTADLPAQALRSGGIYLVRVRNSAAEVSGEAVNFQINNLVPQITSLNPSGPIIFGPGPGPIQLDLVVNGSNFHAPGPKDPGTVIGISITPDAYPAINPLIGSTPQCALVNSRFAFPIGVRAFDIAGNPIAGVSVTFTAPTVVTTEPAGFFPGGSSTVTVETDANGFAIAPVFTANPFSGTYIVSATATISGFPLTTIFALTNLNAGDTCGALSSISFVSSQQVIVSVPIAQTGTYTVQAVNSSPGGGYSSPLISFVVTKGPPESKIPSIISMLPNAIKAGSSDFVLTVNGTNFQSNSWINFGTVRLAPQSVSANTLKATVPKLLISSSGIVPVTVTNPGDTGGTSRRVDFRVNP